MSVPLDVILRENPKAQVLLAGPDPHPELLAQAKALAARWPGRVAVRGQRVDMRQILSGTDVFLMPSVEEPCGIAQMEAQALGAPVLYLNHHGLRSSVLPWDGGISGTGFAVEPGSQDALLAGLRRATEWASRPAEQKATLQRNAMKFAEENLDIERMALNHAALMREAMLMVH